jgi:hypothetical protein
VKLLVTVDVGSTYLAFAAFDKDTKKLIHAELIKSDLKPPYAAFDCVAKLKKTLATHPDEMVAEIPRHLWKGKLSKLRWLIFMVGCLGQEFAGRAHALGLKVCEFTAQDPDEWKGTIDGNITIDRVKMRIEPDEWERMQHQNEHTYDAVGIGFRRLGRLHR